MSHRNTEPFVDADENFDRLAEVCKTIRSKARSNAIWLDELRQQQQRSMIPPPPPNTQNSSSSSSSSETTLILSSKIFQNISILREYHKTLGELIDVEDECVKIQKEKDGLTKKLSDLKSKRATLVEDFEFLSKTQDMLFCLSVGTFVGWAATKLFVKE
jgi:hypothetical protein|tara:strand:- start:300 stop:776 length:477 start_codon:yes stop_codon:yes gene_type:complete